MSKESVLPRLTKEILSERESKLGKAAAWHWLTLDGYAPEEIAVWNDHAYNANDIRQTVRTYAERNNLPTPASCGRRREVIHRDDPTDWREAFKVNVMRVGMQLSLTQPMLEYLCATADGVMWDRMGTSSLVQPCNSIATGLSLRKRGLIRHRPQHLRDNGTIDMSKHTFGDSYDELTEAGEAVVQLLKCVGVFIEADRAIEKRAGKASA